MRLGSRSRTFFWVLLGLSTFLSKTAFGLKCYECIRGDDSEPGELLCDDFDKADEAERKSHFSVNCPPSATGCAFMRISLTSRNEAGIVTSKSVNEGLECFDPDANLSSMSQMNKCVESVDTDDESEYKICVCDIGDHCIQAEPLPPDSNHSSGMQVPGLNLVMFVAVIGILFKMEFC